MRDKDDIAMDMLNITVWLATADATGHLKRTKSIAQLTAEVASEGAAVNPFRDQD